MVLEQYLHVQISVLTSAHSRFALASHLESLAVINARGNFNFKLRFFDFKAGA